MGPEYVVSGMTCHMERSCVISGTYSDVEHPFLYNHNFPNTPNTIRHPPSSLLPLRRLSQPQNSGTIPVSVDGIAGLPKHIGFPPCRSAEYNRIRRSQTMCMWHHTQISLDGCMPSMT